MTKRNASTPSAPAPASGSAFVNALTSQIVENDSFSGNYSSSSSSSSSSINDQNLHGGANVSIFYLNIQTNIDFV